MPNKIGKLFKYDNCLGIVLGNDSKDCENYVVAFIGKSPWWYDPKTYHGKTLPKCYITYHFLP
ncbi:MAG: hypothetical protein Q8P81_03560 [Nanoarchaeota archaeon]|nr:hypothetical protein [Nanoarchaeota archaeon]